jgi:uncharacterized protein YqgC (DUF456 family)
VLEVILSILAGGCLIFASLVFWLLTLVGLPGTWLIAAGVAIYSYVIPSTWRVEIEWPWIIALLVLALFGEVLEFLGGVLGTQRAGGSRRAAVLALIGSLLGGLSGAMIGLPIPMLGSLVGAVLFGAIGAAAGAFLGEISLGTATNKTWQVSWGAFWGRLLGTGAKSLVGALMVATVVVALCTRG